MKKIIFAAILLLSFCFIVFAQDKNCPKIKLVSPNTRLESEKITIFEIKVGEQQEKQNLSYEWTFSKGKIIRGQGTPKVEFLVDKKDEGLNVDLSVKIAGLPKNCNDIYSDIIPIAQPPIGEPLDRFGKLKTFEEYAYLIDNFMLALKENSSWEGLILISFNKKDSRNYKISHLKKIYKFLNFRKYDLTRFTFSICENDYEEKTSHWIVPNGAKYPMCDSDALLIKAEELNQKINQLFTKK